MSAAATLVVLILGSVWLSPGRCQIYNRDFYLKQYLENPMYASGAAQGLSGFYRPTPDYYPSFHHPSTGYYPPIYGYPYPPSRSYEPYGQGYGQGYGRSPYGYGQGSSYYGMLIRANPMSWVTVTLLL